MARVLVAGTEGWCGSVSSALTAAGYAVLPAFDLFAAAALALSTYPSVIVTQSALQGGSGPQLCRLVQAELPLGGIPVLVVLGEGELDAGFRARGAGAAGYAHDIEGVLQALPTILAQPALTMIATSADPAYLVERLPVVLDDALRDGQIAADIRALANVEGLGKMFEGLVDVVSQVLPCAWIGLVVNGEQQSFFLHVAGDHEDAEREAREVLGVESVTRSIEKRIPTPRLTSAPSVREATEVPIFFGDAQVGQLAVSLPRSTDSANKRCVGLIAYELGGPLKIMALLEQVQRSAATDALTGLTNRRAFLDLVRREQSHAARYSQHTSFLVVDIDHFKGVNDVHGHLAGDVILRGVARALCRATRTTDIVCRWGGEEFVVALPQTDLEGALSAAERVRAEIEATSHALPAGSSLTVTASIGAASAATTPWTLEAVLAKADAALYEAKRAGRNRVRCEPVDEASPEALDTGFRQAC